MMTTQKKYPSNAKLINTGIIDAEESINMPQTNFKEKNMQNTHSAKQLNDIMVKRKINDYSLEIGKLLRVD